MRTYLASGMEDMEQICELQRLNLRENLDKHSVQKNGFVTLQHNPDLLMKMNRPHPHILAREGSRLAGYALCMMPEMKDHIPKLSEMFKLIDELAHSNPGIIFSPYFIMGQICIGSEFRGQGVFNALYNEMKVQMKGKYRMVITEISEENPRSLRAHLRQGFRCIGERKGDDLQHWYLVSWDWSDPS